MFDTLLIANRGEIACRVILTARRLGIRTVAVYSDADAQSRHVALADTAYHIGPAPAQASYLDKNRLIEAIRNSSADAVHPGYGFLSENADFAEAVAAAGAVFVGPPPEAIRAMGSKSNAKTIMGGAGVPLVPGYHGDNQDPAFLAETASKIGYPVLIKASAGGGGRGMRRVDSAAEFEKALEGAMRESKSAFGDDTMLIEKFVTRPRHIEMQVFADAHGNAVHLFERDCSIQRRHQKVVEEAPAPGINTAVRDAMGAAALAAAKAIGYQGAGTVEFIVEGARADQPDSFYFMEMNTRLQVEHPVTEMITGVDLVAWQLQVAAGDPLPVGQDDIIATGHAVEVRLYAENPARNFMPQTGQLDHLRFPADSANVRIDTGIREGDAVSMYYDPMIAKVITWDSDRAAALRRMRGALAETKVAGLNTNLSFLSAIAAHPSFAAAELETGFIETHLADLVPETTPASNEILALAGLSELLRLRSDATQATAISNDPHSPWFFGDAWRANGCGDIELRFLDGDIEQVLRARPENDGYRIDLTDTTAVVRGTVTENGLLLAEIDGVRIAATVVGDGTSMQIIVHGQNHHLGRVDPMEAAAAQALGGKLTAPMPGRVVAVHVADGEKVKAGQSLIVLEAMKMEHVIAAPADGIVSTVRFAAGDQVMEGDELLAMADA
ncbi:MAG: biotin/lipoyl-binding protein [Alphaproteobacteria bacterium]|nr:biotin/lipoyl-binding protein [Alphaproteobacteria bacterium]